MDIEERERERERDNLFIDSIGDRIKIKKREYRKSDRIQLFIIIYI